MSSLERRSAPSGSLPCRHDSYMRLPMSFWMSSIVSLSAFVTAWPRRESTLKLLVCVGKMRNATTVLSGNRLRGLDDFDEGLINRICP